MTVVSDGVRAVIVDDVTEVEVIVVLVAGSVGGPDAFGSASFAFSWALSPAFQPCDFIPSHLYRSTISFLVHRVVCLLKGLGWVVDQTIATHVSHF